MELKSLKELSMECLLKYGDCIEDVEGIPYKLLLPVLCKMGPEMLAKFEEKNQSFKKRNNILWKKFCFTKARYIDKLDGVPKLGYKKLYFDLLNEEKRRGIEMKKIFEQAKEEEKAKKEKLANIRMRIKPDLGPIHNNKSEMTIFDKFRKEKRY
ncbi:hypothetical protein K502DRAFT_369079 [Neoconidiobolus thromboides FSU 785]|nr:hypothetical protein K502DRAFT_369079 [Neoconidiobolus thromboides FSU 785]